MIKNLLVSGCSFTAGYHFNQKTWPWHVADAFNIKCTNIAYSGAGNGYISNSIIDVLESGVYHPDETLVVVMWSGTSRCDVRVSEEFWNELDYNYKFKSNNDNFYVGSCGTGNAWQDNKITKLLFEMQYLSSDPVSLCNNSIRNFLNLENYLITNKYKFKFTSFYNMWTSDVHEFTSDVGEPLLGKYVRKFDLTNWFFVNSNKDSLWEYTKANKLIANDKWHPNDLAHKQYAEQIVVPTLQECFK